MNVRSYKPADAFDVARVFTQSIRATASRHYSPEQIAAWAPDPPDVNGWSKFLNSQIVFVAEHDGKVTGFVTLEGNGHLDCLYVLGDFQRRGIATALCKRVEKDLAARGITRIFSEVSITARPFFEFAGFRVIAPQTVECRGKLFTNYNMEKFIQP